MNGRSQYVMYNFLLAAGIVYILLTGQGCYSYKILTYKPQDTTFNVNYDFSIAPVINGENYFSLWIQYPQHPYPDSLTLSCDFSGIHKFSVDSFKFNLWDIKNKIKTHEMRYANNNFVSPTVTLRHSYLFPRGNPIDTFHYNYSTDGLIFVFPPKINKHKLSDTLYLKMDFFLSDSTGHPFEFHKQFYMKWYGARVSYFVHYGLGANDIEEIQRNPWFPKD